VRLSENTIGKASRNDARTANVDTHSSLRSSRTLPGENQLRTAIRKAMKIPVMILAVDIMANIIGASRPEI
jgi:hypothetical protein